MQLPEQFYTVLRAFVSEAQKNPDLLRSDDKLSFFRDFLEGWGAKIPVDTAPCTEDFKQDETADAKCNDAECHGHDKCHEKEAESSAESATEEEEEEEPLPANPEDEIDDSLILSEPTRELHPATKPADAELNEAEEAELTKYRQASQTAIEDGDNEAAFQAVNEIVRLSPKSAMLYCKRAALLLKLKAPAAAKRDCNAALEVNSDYARAYRLRGVARRWLGEWESASHDISTAQSMDFDDSIEDIEKLVHQKASAIAAYARALKKREETAERKRRLRASKKARKIYERQKREEAEAEKERKAAGDFFGAGGMPGMPGGMPGGMGGMPGGMPGGMGGMPGGMGGMPGGMPGGMTPEMAALFSNPKIMAAMADLQQNPGNFMKYMGDPEIMAAMKTMMGGAGAGAGAGMKF